MTARINLSVQWVVMIEDGSSFNRSIAFQGNTNQLVSRKPNATNPFTGLDQSLLGQKYLWQRLSTLIKEKCYLRRLETYQHGR